MPQTFDAQNPPFDRLTHDQISQLRSALDIGYFRPGEAIISQGQRSDNLRIVIKAASSSRAPMHSPCSRPMACTQSKRVRCTARNRRP